MKKYQNKLLNNNTIEAVYWSGFKSWCLLSNLNQVALPAAVPALAAVPAVAAVPTVTSVHSQRLIPQAPDVHTVAHPTTVLKTVQTGNAIVGHQHVGDQVVGKTADVNGYAFKSEVRHDAPIHAVAAPVVHPAPVAVAAPAPAPVAVAGPLALPAPAPVAVAPAPALPLLSAVPAPAPVQTVHPAPPAHVKSYTVETGHQIAHDHVVTSPVIKNTVHSPVIGHQPIIGQVPVAAAPVVAAPAPLAYPAPAPAPLPAY